MEKLQNEKVVLFIKTLLQHSTIQKLKLVDDKGITVSTHTYDVLRTAVWNIKKDYPNNMEQASKRIDFFALVVGVIIHDTTKATLRLSDSNISHSNVMRKYPELVEEEAEFILSEVEDMLNLKIKEEIKTHIKHIVVSHHGRWGKVRPETLEARIVHEADKYSALYHRITPIGAKKIVKLMSEGYRKEEIIKMTGYTEGIITDRLKRAKQELKLKTNRDLIKHYLRKGKIPDGDSFFTKRINEIQNLIYKVEKVGFEELILQISLINYMKDFKVF
ncbi:MAG: HD domain-containing protein [Fusobacteria bacterium]|nr:HD domain-containing protein [Fusobacteriota bacterium]